MAYRFTNTEKWDDAWFSELKPVNKLLYLYLCDKCDIAGFLEINTKKIAFDLGLCKQDVEGGLKSLNSKFVFSADNKYLFIRNFLKHQKNYPFNEKSTTYKKIIECLNAKLQLFNNKNIEDFFNTPSMGHGMGYPYPVGNINNNIDNLKEKEKESDVSDVSDVVKKREDVFYDECAKFVGQYPQQMIREFYDYWTEMNKSGTQMRFEKEKTWELSKRLARWSKNNFK